MSIEKKPFVNYTLDEDKNTKTETITIRLNRSERSMLEEIKEDFNIKSDGKALKLAAEIGKNVTQGLLGRGRLQYLFKKDRVKLSDF